jgi:hypothetical protein
MLWKIQGGFGLVDLENEFFLAKFSNHNHNDHDFALFERPWMVSDHYLIVRQWHLNFDSYEATIEKVAEWVRLTYLAMEYYDNSVLWKIKNYIGNYTILVEL